MDNKNGPVGVLMVVILIAAVYLVAALIWNTYDTWFAVKSERTYNSPRAVRLSPKPRLRRTA